VLILLDREALEPALIERTLSGGVVMGMPAVGVGDLNPLHPGGKIGVAGGQDDQMPVIGHEAVGQQLRGIGPGQGLMEHALKGGVVAVFLEDGKAQHAAVEDVIGESGFGDARRTRHGEHGTDWPSECQENHPDTFYSP